MRYIVLSFLQHQIPPNQNDCIRKIKSKTSHSPAGDFPLGDFRAAGDLGDLGDAAAALGEALAFLGVEVSPSSSLTGAERRRSWLMDFFRGVLAGTRGLPNGVFCCIGLEREKRRN